MKESSGSIIFLAWISASPLLYDGISPNGRVVSMERWQAGALLEILMIDDAVSNAMAFWLDGPIAVRARIATWSHADFSAAIVSTLAAKPRHKEMGMKLDDCRYDGSKEFRLSDEELATMAACRERLVNWPSE